jgi:hypothetical protein
MHLKEKSNHTQHLRAQPHQHRTKLRNASQHSTRRGTPRRIPHPTPEPIQRRPALPQRQRMFRFHPTERSHRKPAPAVSLQVFNVRPRPLAGFLQRLHRPMAIRAAHHLIAFHERFPQRARHPSPTHLHLTLRHHRRLLLRSHCSLTEARSSKCTCACPSHR